MTIQKKEEELTWDNLPEEELVLYDQCTRSNEPWDKPVDRSLGDASLSLAVYEGKEIERPSYIQVELSKKERKFVQNRINGMTLADAYFDAFLCKSSIKKSQAVIKARNLEKKEYIQVYKENLLLQLDTLFKEKALWSREQSVRSLKKLIHAAEEEIADNDTALQIKLELITESLEDGSITMQTAMQQTADLLSRRRLSKNTQAAITEAVKELNSMFGFDGEHVDKSDAISFVDYERLTD